MFLESVNSAASDATGRQQIPIINDSINLSYTNSVIIQNFSYVMMPVFIFFSFQCDKPAPVKVWVQGFVQHRNQRDRDPRE